MSHKERRQAFYAAKAQAAQPAPQTEAHSYGVSRPIELPDYNAINFSVMDRMRSIQMLDELKESNRLQRSSREPGSYLP